MLDAAEAPDAKALGDGGGSEVERQRATKDSAAVQVATEILGRGEESSRETTEATAAVVIDV